MFSCGYFVENIEEPPSFEEPLSLSKNTPSSFFGSEERRTPPHPRSSDFEDRRPSRDGNDTPGVEVDRRLTDHLQLRETCTSFSAEKHALRGFKKDPNPALRGLGKDSLSWANVFFLWVTFPRTRPILEFVRFRRFSDFRYLATVYVGEGIYVNPERCEA